MTGGPHSGSAPAHAGSRDRAPGDARHSHSHSHSHDHGHGQEAEAAAGHRPGHGSALQDVGDRFPLDAGAAPRDASQGQDQGRNQDPGRALVVTASNRAAAGVYADQGGPVIAGRLEALGFAVAGPRVVPDGDPVEQALRDGVGAGYAVIVTTGGTGISPTDRTPEATRAVIDYEVPGIAEAIRAFGRRKVPTAALSRGIAGVADRTLIVNLPGSTGGVKDGMAVLEDLLPHAVAQLSGADHPRPPSTSGAQEETLPGLPGLPGAAGEVPPGGAH